MIFSRRFAAAFAAAALILGACQQASEAAGGQSRFERPGDMALGAANAPVTVVEYASVTCGHCAAWHEQVWPTVKERYVDSGRVRFVFREFPTPPAQIAVAGFQVARCGNASTEQYFTRLSVLFKQQRTILQAAATGQARQALLDVALSAGLSEAQFDSCVTNPAAAKRINDNIAFGQEQGVTGTPTFFINDERAEDPSLAGFTAALDRALASK